MRAGMPRDFDELVQHHGHVIATVAPRDVLCVAHHLWYRGILENFRPKPILSRGEVIEYLGIPVKTWKNAVYLRPHVLPPPVEGSPTDFESKYRFSDAERCFGRREELLPRSRRQQQGFMHPKVPGLDDFLVTESTKLVEELEMGYIFDVPPDLPQTDDAIYAAYSGTVARVVRYRLKFGLDVEDAIGSIWVKLLSSSLLVKFMRSGPKRLPALLTTDETLDFLGVDWPEWRRKMACYRGAPNPVKGSSNSQDAIYRAEDIRALDESGRFKTRGLRFLPAASVSRQLFDGYVSLAAEHALMNLFRTLERRFNREDTLQDGACIQDNSRVRTLRRDDFDLAWEDTLSSNTIAADSLIDIKRRVELLEVQQTA